MYRECVDCPMFEDCDPETCINEEFDERQIRREKPWYGRKRQMVHKIGEEEETYKKKKTIQVRRNRKEKDGNRV